MPWTAGYGGGRRRPAQCVPVRPSGDGAAVPGTHPESGPETRSPMDLDHRFAGDSSRGTGDRTDGAQSLEDRKRDLQHAEEPGVRSGTPLRSRSLVPCEYAGDPDDAGVSGGSDPAVVLPALPSRPTSAGQLCLPVGKDARCNLAAGPPQLGTVVRSPRGVRNPTAVPDDPILVPVRRSATRPAPPDRGHPSEIRRHANRACLGPHQTPRPNAAKTWLGHAEQGPETTPTDGKHPGAVAQNLQALLFHRKRELLTVGRDADR